jgi:hypothetical protein
MLAIGMMRIMATEIDRSGIVVTTYSGLLYRQGPSRIVSADQLVTESVRTWTLSRGQIIWQFWKLGRYCFSGSQNSKQVSSLVSTCGR